MNERKSLLRKLIETIDEHRAEQRTLAPELRQQQRRRKLSRIAHWFLPNGGTLLMMVLLIATQSIWSRPLRSPSATFINTISYQGRLADTGGNPLTDLYNMEFRIYDVPDGGTPLWEEYWTGGNSVNVSDGLFNVMLGSLDNTLASAIAGHDELYLGITVGTDSEMSPRVPLGSVPFSFQAQEALTVSDGSVTTNKIADGAVTPAKLATVAQRIDCFAPTGSSLFDLTTSGAWSDDLFSCSFTAPSAGFMFLSLQAHQRTSNGAKSCIFSIFVDGVNINTAGRDLPSDTYFTNWHPTHMADTVEVEAGTHTLSVRLKSEGTNTCSIHDPDINGIFIPTS